MSDAPINLNKVRKARARAQAVARADRNAVTFGRSKAQKLADRKENLRLRRDLDSKTLKSPSDVTDPGSKKP